MTARSAFHVAETPEGAVIDIRVVPRARRSAIAGARQNALLVRLASAPVDGAANRELVALLATVIDCPRRDVRILSGGANRAKRVLVSGRSRATVISAIDSVLTPDAR